MYVFLNRSILDCLTDFNWILEYSFCWLRKWNKIKYVEIHLQKRLSRKPVQRFWSKPRDFILALYYLWKYHCTCERKTYLSAQGCSEYLNIVCTLGQWDSMELVMWNLLMLMWLWCKERRLVKKKKVSRHTFTTCKTDYKWQIFINYGDSLVINLRNC